MIPTPSGYRLERVAFPPDTFTSWESFRDFISVECVANKFELDHLNWRFLDSGHRVVYFRLRWSDSYSPCEAYFAPLDALELLAEV